jgi:hypothetical protein
MGRADTPADVQLSRALIAVALGLALALGLLHPIVEVPGVRAVLPELRAVAGIPCLVIESVRGVF